jgi:hypothetical protein
MDTCITGPKQSEYEQHQDVFGHHRTHCLDGQKYSEKEKKNTGMDYELPSLELVYVGWVF